MLTTVEGTYRNGHIELKEEPAGIRLARVLVTFVEEGVAEAPGFRELSPADRRERLMALQRVWASRLSPSNEFAKAKVQEIEIEERRAGSRDA
jgi:hypothetical protein